MRENLTGLVKILGIAVLLIALWVLLSIFAFDNFLTGNNIENLLRRTALYGVLGIGVAFVIISSGIDLSLGSLVCLSGILFAMFLEVTYQPYDQTPIWHVEIGSRVKVLLKDHDFDVGDEVFLYRDRKTKGLLTVEQIKPHQQGQTSYQELTLAGTLRGKSSEEVKQTGYISKTYSFTSETVKVAPESGSANGEQNGEAIVRTKILFDAQLGVAAKDKMKFLHKTKGAKERPVIAAEAGAVTLDSEVTGLEDYRAVPYQRKPRMSIPMALSLVLLIAVGLGLLHGLLVTKLNQQPFIITLCGLLIYRGVARHLASDQPRGFIEYNDSLGLLGSGRWVIWESADASFGIPFAFFVLIVIAIFAIVLLNFTVWGRYLMALGRNEEAAMYSGINTDFVKIGAYVLCAVLTAIGGIMFAIDANSVPPASFGNFFELYAIAAAVLGGCSLRGGEGSIIGVIIGTALMQTLYNLIVLMGIPDTLEFTIIGAVILIGVVADELVRKSVSGVRN